MSFNQVSFYAWQSRGGIGGESHVLNEGKKKLPAVSTQDKLTESIS